MKKLCLLGSVLGLFLLGEAAWAASKPLQIYFIDVDGGQATLFVGWIEKREGAASDGDHRRVVAHPRVLDHSERVGARRDRCRHDPHAGERWAVVDLGGSGGIGASRWGVVNAMAGGDSPTPAGGYRHPG